jgi:hypothetical protein
VAPQPEQQVMVLQEVAHLNLDQMVPADAVVLLTRTYNRALGEIDFLKGKLATLVAEKKKIYEDYQAINVKLCNLKIDVSCKNQDGQIRQLDTKLNALEAENSKLKSCLKRVADENTELRTFNIVHANAAENSAARNALGEELVTGACEKIFPGADFTVRGEHSTVYIAKYIDAFKGTLKTKTADQIKDHIMHIMFEDFFTRERGLMKSLKDLQKEKREAVSKDAEKTAEMAHEEDFYKRMYYEQMVCDTVTGELFTNEFSEVVPIWKQYQEKNNALLEEILHLKETTPKQETLTLLRNVQLKARVFKLKYKFVKEHMVENFFVDNLDDEFCEVEAKHDDDSDDELRWVPRRRIQQQDPALVPGFSLRPSRADD